MLTPSSGLFRLVYSPLVLLFIALVFASVVSGNPVLKNLEFNGLLKMGATERFSFHNKVSGESFWLKMGQSFDGLSIRSWDENSETLTLELRGQTRSLGLKRPRIVKLELRTLAEIRSDPVVAARNAQQERVEEAVGMDQFVGYMVLAEYDKARRKKEREKAILRSLARKAGSVDR
ncbi:hypothetical protein VDG1235_3676 [Verrucomicrobiia bacterium DG1235]|nr:hypothetical protein VDG1235_3676 [Verrucomicrobiae bacterium DG1235]